MQKFPTTRHALILATIVALAACTNTSPTASIAPADTLSITSPAPGPTVLSEADPLLAAKFPATIDGQPVTNLQTFHFVEYLKATGVRSTLITQFATAASQAGINPNSVNLGQANVTAGGKPYLLQALRAGGVDGSKFMQPLEVVARLRNVGANATPRDVAVVPGTVGGKSVQIARSPDLTQYYYPTGDTEFILNNVDETAAGTILAALP
jgi:hypothetical protein